MEMKVQVGKTWDDGHGRLYMELQDDAQAAEIYRVQKDFWTRRMVPEGLDYDQDYVKRIISQQSQDYTSDTHRAMRDALESLIGENGISILEIGAANGSTPRHFARFLPQVPLRFLGVEALAFLAEDGQAQFPQHKIVTGTAEDFISMSTEHAGGETYDVFLASLVLCMLLPDLAFKVLGKAAEACDVIVCRDYVTNKGGEISQTRPVLFQMAPGHQHMVFAHPFEAMFRRLGFSRIECTFEEGTDDRIRGMGTFVARRRS